MSDENETGGFQARAFDELVRLGKWIVDRRKLTRSDIFSKDIEPLIDELDRTHEDFLVALRKMEVGISSTLAAESRKQNSINEELERQISICHDVSELIEKGRLQRRKLFEKCLARYVDLRQNGAHQIGKRAFLMPSDLELITKFYDALMAYFTNDASEYDHNVRTMIGRVESSLEAAKFNGVTEMVVNDLRQHLSDLTAMEDAFSNNWSNAVQFRFQLEARLT
ncbi:MAG: hypothetical protein AAF198_11860 [Pseudomonadota bacterium]